MRAAAVAAAAEEAGMSFMPAGASLSWMVAIADLGCCCWMTAAAVGSDFDVAAEAADITRCRLAADCTTTAGAVCWEAAAAAGGFGAAHNELAVVTAATGDCGCGGSGVETGVCCRSKCCFCGLRASGTLGSVTC